jgi:fluoroacetyl-CoA thioesterase
MKDTLTVGLPGEARHIVTKEMSAPHIPKVVLSTPAMIGLIEYVCLETARPHLEESETTVGTHVCVSHHAAALLGEEATFRCRLAKIERRRLTFDVEVDGPAGRISEGTHERAVVSLERMR